MAEQPWFKCPQVAVFKLMRRLSPAEFHILLYLEAVAACPPTRAFADASYGEILSACGIAFRTFRDALKSLQAMGLLRVERRKAGGRHLKTRYTIDWNAAASIPADTASCVSGSSRDGSGILRDGQPSMLRNGQPSMLRQGTTSMLRSGMQHDKKEEQIMSDEDDLTSSFGDDGTGIEADLTRLLGRRLSATDRETVERWSQEYPKGWVEAAVSRAGKKSSLRNPLGYIRRTLQNFEAEGVPANERGRAADDQGRRNVPPDLPPDDDEPWDWPELPDLPETPRLKALREQTERQLAEDQAREAAAREKRKVLPDLPTWEESYGTAETAEPREAYRP